MIEPERAKRPVLRKYFENSWGIKKEIPTKIAEIKLHISGNDLFSKRQCKTFEEAVDTSIDALKIQIKKHKEKVKGI